MDKAGNPQPEEMAEVRVETVRPLITSFFKGITEEQWRSLKSGEPDDATKIMLAELLLDMITSMSKALFTALRSMNVVVSEERVLSSLDETLPQSFAQVLGVQDQVRCLSSERLMDLIGKEVAESVNSALSTSSRKTESVTTQRVTPPRRLNAMVGHVCKMLKAFMAKVKMSCSLRPRRQRSSPASSTQKHTQEELEMEDLESEDIDDVLIDESPVTTPEQETPEKVSSSEDSIISTNKAVQELIKREMSEIIEPLLDDVSDSDYELLQSETSLEIESVADDIAQIIAKEVKSLEETDAAGPRPKLSLKGAGNKIKTFFAKRFAQASIHRIVTQLKAKFHGDTAKVESRQSMKSLVDSIDSLLLTNAGETKQGGNEVCVFQGFRKLSSGKVLIFTQGLSDLLYSHIAAGMTPEIVPEALRRRATCRTVCVPQSHAAMYADIQTKVWCFLALMSWWMNTQVGRHSERVTLALMDTQTPLETSPVPSPVREETRAEPEHSAKAPAEKNKRYVWVLLEKLVMRTFRKAGVAIRDTDIIVQRLLSKTWAEVEGEDLYITPKTFKDLDRAIFKDLCKKWGCAEMVLVSLTLEEPAIEKWIVSLFKHHLTTPPKNRSAICRFFSAVGKAISRPFR